MLGRFFNLTKKSNLNGRLEYDWKHFLVIWWFTFLCHLYSLYKTSGGFANFFWGCLPSPSSRFLPSSSFPFQIPPVLLDVGVDLLYCSCWIWVSAVINQSIKFKWTNAKALQSLYINMGRMGRYYMMPGNYSEKGKFKFMVKCRQCSWWHHFWRKTVPIFYRRNTKRSVADCLKACLCYEKIRCKFPSRGVWGRASAEIDFSAFLP